MRKRRVLKEGALYHVISRANRKEMILKPNEIKELFLQTVARAKKKYSFVLENFCIMENHFHFLIRPGKGESLSRIMHWIKFVFAIKYNQKMGLTGHVWGDRFFSRIVNGFRQFLAAFIYIDLNPVVSGLVKRIEDWCHCGSAHHRRGFYALVEKPVEWILQQFPSHREEINREI
jgi:REP element-mobilizing transposase RayT